MSVARSFCSWDKIPYVLGCLFMGSGICIFIALLHRCMLLAGHWSILVDLEFRAFSPVARSAFLTSSHILCIGSESHHRAHSPSTAVSRSWVI